MIEGILKNQTTRMWERICPQCKHIVSHKNKYHCNNSNRDKTLCKRCASTTIIIIPPEVFYQDNHWYRKCPKCQNKIPQQSKASAIHNILSVCKKCYTDMEKQVSNTIKEKLSEKALARWATTEFRNKMSKHLHSIRITNIKGRNIVVSFNPKVCKFIDRINEVRKDMCFRHHLNHPDGEFSVLCYFADGYDEKNNVWFEYDEPHHEIPFIKKRDIVRQKRIIGFLKCRFIRYSEKNDSFNEILPNGEIQKIDRLI